MECYRSAGEDSLALAAAETVRRSIATPARIVLAPMRLAEAELAKATVLARTGEFDQATSKVDQAFSRARQSRPSLLLVSREVADVVQRSNPDDPAAADFAHHLQALDTVA